MPVLYGPVEYLGESAVTTLLQLLLDARSKEKPDAAVVSDYEIRRPAHVADIAKIVGQLASKMNEVLVINLTLLWKVL